MGSEMCIRDRSHTWRLQAILLSFYFSSYRHRVMSKSSKRSHDECRRAICIVCGGKSDPGEEISSELLKMIREFVMEDFSLNDDRFPAGLCKSHVNLLHEYKRGIFTRKLSIQSFEPYYRCVTRNSCDDGTCHVCNTARSNPCSGTMPRKPKRGRPPNNTAHQSSYQQVLNFAPSAFHLLDRVYLINVPV